MKASELVAEVQRIAWTAIDANDYTTADILGFINRGRVEIAGGGDRPHGNPKLAPLPNLLTSDTVTVLADENTVALPADYQRGIVRAKATRILRRYDSLKTMLDRYDGLTGEPDAYCVKGLTLWVAPTPTGNTDLEVWYHERPTDLVIAAGPPAVDDIPTELPEALHHKLLVSFACREIFSESESGIDMPHPDTIKHERRYQNALDDLEREIGAEEGDPTNIADDFLTEDNIW